MFDILKLILVSWKIESLKPVLGSGGAVVDGSGSMQSCKQLTTWCYMKSLSETETTFLSSQEQP